MVIWKTELAALLLVLTFAVMYAPDRTAAESVVAERVATTSASEAARLERDKFEYQKALEEKKLEVERLKAWLTGGSILIPLLLGRNYPRMAITYRSETEGP